MLLSLCGTTEGIAHKCVSVGWCMRLDDKHIHSDTDTPTQKWHQAAATTTEVACSVLCGTTVHVHSIVYKVSVVQAYRRTPSNICKSSVSFAFRMFIDIFMHLLWPHHTCSKIVSDNVLSVGFIAKCAPQNVTLFCYLSWLHPMNLVQCSLHSSESAVVFVWALGINKRLLNGDNFQFRIFVVKISIRCVYVYVFTDRQKTNILSNKSKHIVCMKLCLLQN